MSYPVNAAKTVYIRVPKDLEKKNVEISLNVPTDKDVYLKVDLLDKSSRDIPANCNCSPSHCRTCQVHYCPVYQEQADLYELPSPIKGEHVQKTADDDDTIPGHPNCKRGECKDCHVVSCPIYLGYEEEP